MKIVKELLRPSFILFGFLLVLSEIIIIIIFQLTFRAPINNSIPKFKLGNKEILIKAGENVGRLLMKKILRLSFDLLFIGKHSSLDVNSTTTTDDTPTTGPKVRKDSKLYETYGTKDCLIPLNSIEELSTNAIISKYYNETTQKLNYLDVFLATYPSSMIQNLIINRMLYEPVLNKMSYYNSDTSNLAMNENIKHSACFDISMIKTLFIKEFIISRDQIGFVQFIIIKDTMLFIYPPNYYKDTFLSTSDFFHFKDKCSEDYSDFPQCLNILDYFEGGKNAFIYPKFGKIGDKVAFNICMKIPFGNDDNTVICADVDFTKICQNFQYEGDEIMTMSFFNVEKTNNDVNYDVFYSNLDSFKNFYYYDDEFGEYQLSEKKNNTTLFHYLYNDIFSNTTYKRSDKIRISNIINEYQEIKEAINEAITEIEQEFEAGKTDNITHIFLVNKTFSYTYSVKQKRDYSKDEYLITITPIIINTSEISDLYFLKKSNDNKSRKILFYSLLAIQLTPTFTANWLGDIFLYKNLRLFIFYVVLAIFLTVSFYLLANVVFDFLLSSINTIKKDFKDYSTSKTDFQVDKFRFMEKSERIKNLEEEKKTFEELLQAKKSAKNKEMADLENTFGTMKKIIFLKKIITNNNLQYHKKNFIKFLETIKDDEIREICTLILAYSNFQEGKYYSAMKELNSLIQTISQKESKLLNSTDNFDAQIKDMIKRFSEIAYVNEYSTFKGMNETILPVIKVKQLSQKLFYLYALCKYRYVVESKTNFTKKPCDLSHNHPLEEAIDYFKKARAINHSLGMNPIKEIYSLIMLAKCNVYHRDYKTAKNILNDALVFFNEVLKLFKDTHNKNFYPKIMLFVFNTVFQNIMLSIAQCLYENNKLCLAGLICYKIFETSLFIHKPLHLEASNLMCNIIKDLKNDYTMINNGEGSENTNNFRIRKKTSETKENQKILALLEKKQKLYDKIYSRMLTKKKNVKRKDLNTSQTYTNNQSGIKETKMSSGNLLGNELFVNNMNKEIIICISERAILSFHGTELKDVLIKYLQEFFSNNDNDLFSYLQFSSNGKKTVYLKQLRINQLIQKIQMNKNNSELFENVIQSKTKNQFKQLFNIFETCIKSISSEMKGDNIILMFIGIDDIRFTSIKECVDIVNELNDNNFTVILFSCDEIITDTKIKSIKMFLSGLIEGYFIHVKNYQIIKQVFMNIASNDKQEDFFSFGFENINNIII